MEIARASAMRAEAARLLALADAAEVGARAAAVAALGEERGAMAFQLAMGSETDGPDPEAEIPPSKPSPQPTEAPAPAEAAQPAAPVVPAPVAAPSEPQVPAPAPAAPRPSPVLAAAVEEPRQAPQRQPEAERTVMHGVEIPAGRSPEAEEVVRLAASAAAQGRKQHPYATDRGKNAWRKALFTAALAEHLPDRRPATAAEAEQTAAEPPVDRPDLRRVWNDTLKVNQWREFVDGVPVDDGIPAAASPVEPARAPDAFPLDEVVDEPRTPAPPSAPEPSAAPAEVPEVEVVAVVVEAPAVDPEPPAAAPIPGPAAAVHPAETAGHDLLDDLEDGLVPPAVRGDDDGHAAHDAGWTVDPDEQEDGDGDESFVDLAPPPPPLPTAPRPLPFGRRIAYGNASPKPPGLDEATRAPVQAPPAAAPPPPAPVPPRTVARPSFLSRRAPGPQA